MKEDTIRVLVSNHRGKGRRGKIVHGKQRCTRRFVGTVIWEAGIDVKTLKSIKPV